MPSLAPLAAAVHPQIVDAAAKTPSKSASFLPLIFIALVFGVMYLLVIKPRQRKQQEARAQASTASVGAKVLLAGGFLAEITAVHDDEFDVRLSPDSTASVVKQAVIKVFPAETVEPEPSSTFDGAANEASA